MNHKGSHPSAKNIASYVELKAGYLWCGDGVHKHAENNSSETLNIFKLKNLQVQIFQMLHSLF